MTSTTDGADRTHGAGPTGAADRRAHRVPTRVSVIMPVRNAARTVTAQLAALADQDFSGDWEVVVVDNGSTDATTEEVAAFADRLPLRVVDAPERRGISTARNRGIAAATGDLLLFCDADDVVAEDWISQMVAAARQAALVGGRLDPTRLNPPPLRHSRPAPQSDGLATARWHLPYATGASLGIWAEVIHSLGGFDERFWTCGDDVDLSWRAQSAGHRLAYAPAAVTHYRFRSGTRATLAQAFRYGLADAMLARRHRQHLPRAQLRQFLRPVRDLGQLRDGPTARRAWAWSASLRLGELVGLVHPWTRRLEPLAEPSRARFAVTTVAAWDGHEGTAP